MRIKAFKAITYTEIQIQTIMAIKDIPPYEQKIDLALFYQLSLGYFEFKIP